MTLDVVARPVLGQDDAPKVSTVTDPARHDESSTPAEPSRPRGVWLGMSRPRRANRYAVLATILIVAFVIVLSARLASIDAISPAGPGSASPERLATAAAELHRDAETATHRLAAREASELADTVRAALAVDRFTVLDFNAIGLALHHGGVVEMADHVIAGHLVYVSTRRSSDVAVSVFVLPNRGLAATRPTLPAPDASRSWRRWQRTGDDDVPDVVLQASDERMIYFVVSDDERVMEAVAASITVRASR